MNAIHTLGSDRVTGPSALHKFWRPSLVLGLVTLIFHLFVNRGYGIFRDELYFIVCGRHPAWGYVDQPPIIPLLAAGSYELFGNFLIGFRLIPAIAMAATVALTAEFTRLIGGGRYAQWVAGSCALSAVYFLAIGLLFTTDIFQPLTPLAVPVLSEATYIAYAAALGLNPTATGAERLKIGPLPQHFADMHGWQAMAEKVAAVYHALPPADRAKAVFFGHNYGESAAIDVFGPSLGLPPAIGDHNSYWLWGPRGHDGSVMILIGGDREDYRQKFDSVSIEGEIDDPYAMPYETNQPIYVLRGLHPPLAELWPQIKHYN